MVVGGDNGLRTAAPTAHTPPLRCGSDIHHVQMAVGGAQSSEKLATGTFWDGLCGNAQGSDEHPWQAPQAWQSWEDEAKQQLEHHKREPARALEPERTAKTEGWDMKHEEPKGVADPAQDALMRRLFSMEANMHKQVECMHHMQLKEQETAECAVDLEQKLCMSYTCQSSTLVLPTESDEDRELFDATSEPDELESDEERALFDEVQSDDERAPLDERSDGHMYEREE